MKPKELGKVVEYVKSVRSGNGCFDVVCIGWTTGVNRERDAEKVNSFAEEGMTWWLESLYTTRDSPEGMRKRIRHGLPQVL